jgi:hypothetical protein
MGLQWDSTVSTLEKAGDGRTPALLKFLSFVIVGGLAVNVESQCNMATEAGLIVNSPICT